MMNKRKKIGGGFIPDLEEYEREEIIESIVLRATIYNNGDGFKSDLEEYERENQIKPKTENTLDESEAYEILGLSITATLAQVKKRYRELAKKWHPDKKRKGFRLFNQLRRNKK